MDIRDYLIKRLIEAKISSPRLEADVLLKHFVKNFPHISKSEEENIKNALERRVNSEPLDKIIEKKGFYKFDFKVNSDVLTPRPDTEILVEEALTFIDDNKEYKIADLGTGSGCILLSLLKERNNLRGIGVDISTKALEVACYNAKMLDVLDRVTFLYLSWNDLFYKDEEFDFIVSNPPYIPYKEFLELEKGVKNFDPEIALVGGEDGLVCYREISIIAQKILKKNGYIFLEVGYNQAIEVADIFRLQGFELVKISKDLADINRCVILKK